jgi:hypothetical protein
MAAVAGLQRYQLIHHASGIDVRVNLRNDAPDGTLAEIHRRIQAALTDAGAAPPPISVTESHDFIVTGIGKHRLVIDQATQTAPGTPMDSSAA